MLIKGQKKSWNFGDVDNSRGTLAFDLPPRGFNKATYCITQPWIITAYIYTHYPMGGSHSLWANELLGGGLLSQCFIFIILSISF